MRTLIVAAVIAIGALPGANAQHPGGQQQPAAAAHKGVFAEVDGVIITVDEYDISWATAQRQKFYHRSVPESEVLALRREVGDQLIERVLLTAEARRRGIEPDHAKVREQVAALEARYQASPQWKTIQAERLPALVKEFERQSSVERLQAEVRRVAPGDDAVVRNFYEQHRDLFTEPEQIKFSLILLRVDPSSPSAVWEKAREEAVAIRERIERGADFAEMARLHSSDQTAATGGDMGYVHRGMFPDRVADELTKLQPGEVTQPIHLLEGFALARFVDRKAPQLREFELVRERAGQLWMRDESERRWKAFLAELRKNAAVKVVDASRYPSIAGE